MGQKIARPFLVCSVIVVAMVVSACQTLPLPDNPDQSLVVFTYDRSDVRYPDDRRLESVSLILYEQTTGERTSVRLPSRRNWTAVTLDPGRYRIQEVILGFLAGNDHRWTENRGANVLLFVEAQTVMIPRNSVRIVSLPRSHSTSIGFPLLGREHPLIRDTSQQIRNDRRWQAWEGYTEIHLYRPSNESS